MEENVKDYVLNYMRSNLTQILPPTISDEQILIFLEDRIIYTEEIQSRRWWNDVFAVSQLGDNLIGFYTATTTGDTTPEERGWVFDTDTLCYAEPKEITKTIYVKKD